MKKKRRKSSWIFRIFLLLIICYVAGIFINQRIQLHELNQERAALQKQVNQLKKEISRLENDKKRADDPEYIEKVAREELKMVKPNEIIYIDTNRTKYMLRNEVKEP
ncbi:MAG TPA: cell division protein FtsL [Clostridiales bacterium]|nr:cell division protein FtsL [Clostridiales bacterium]